MQRKAAGTLTRAEHVGHAGQLPPQSTPVSSPFLSKSLQVGHVGQDPPQSTPVSSPFCLLSAQVGHVGHVQATSAAPFQLQSLKALHSASEKQFGHFDPAPHDSEQPESLYHVPPTSAASQDSLLVQP